MMEEHEEFPIPHFWDINFKLGYEPKKGQKIYLSGLNLEERVDFTRRNIMGYVYDYSEGYEDNVRKKPYYSTSFIPGGGFRIEF